MRRFSTELIVTLLLLLTGGPAARADSAGYEIDSTLQASHLTITLSPEGALARHYDEPGDDKAETRRIAVRYSDKSVWAADMTHRTLVKTTTSAWFE